MSDYRDYAAAIGRVLLAALFLISGVGKLLAPTATKAFIASAGLPFPDLAYLVALAMELGVGLIFLIGWQTRLAALALALFSIVTGLAFHHNISVQLEQIMLLKDLAIVGGFLQIFAFGGGAFSLDARAPGAKTSLRP